MIDWCLMTFFIKVHQFINYIHYEKGLDSQQGIKLGWVGIGGETEGFLEKKFANEEETICSPKTLPPARRQC